MSTTASINPASAILRYWESVEILTPPDLPPDSGDKSPRRFPDQPDWTNKQTGQALERVQNTLFLGLFSKEAAAKLCLELIGAEDELGREEDDGALSYLATVQVSPQGFLLPGSFAPSSYALHFERLPLLGLNTSERAGELKSAFDEHFSRLVKSSIGGPAAPTPTGASAAVGKAQVLDMAAWLIGKLRACPATAPRAFLHQRTIWAGDAASVTLDASFYRADLRLTTKLAEEGRLSAPLSAYLSAQPRPEEECRDADNIAEIRDCLHPDHWPGGKWPGRGHGREALVMRQQMAVNEIMRSDASLVSVNGPPGTGKSTLLRDVVAAVICNRALAISHFEDPRNAFSGPFEVSLDGGPARAWKLDDDLRGHGIMVASSNNTAVENITKELPQIEAVAKLYRDDPVLCSSHT